MFHEKAAIHEKEILKLLQSTVRATEVGMRLNTGVANADTMSSQCWILNIQQRHVEIWD